jgi:hypothetical protein
LSIGDEAEDQVQLWGTSAGFTVNPARRDRRGWDHIFELSLPREPRADDPFELLTCAFTARVQVKAVSGACRSVPIKLSNWQRAIDDPLPWFFLVVRYQTLTIREVVLVHINQAVIERVIARVCALPKSAKTHLHRKKFSVKFSDGKLLEQPIERSLHSAIAEGVGRDAFEYAKAKQAWRDDAGYEDKRALNIHMKFGPLQTEDLYRQLARASIGLDALESSQVALSRTRFGRDVPLTSRQPISLQMSWGKEIGTEVVLSVSDCKRQHLASLPMLMRSSTRLFQLPDNFWLIRFESLLIDMVVDVAALRCSVNFNEFPDDEPVSLKALHNDLVFLKSLDDREGEPVELSISRHAYHRPLMHLDAPHTLGRRQYQLAIDVMALWPLLGHLGPEHADVRLTRREISALGDAARLMQMSRSGTDANLFMDIPVEPADVDLTKPIVIITNPHMKLGAITFMDLIALTGASSLVETGENTRIRVTPERCELLLSRQYVGDGMKNFDFDEAAASAGETLERSGQEQVAAIHWDRYTEKSG